MQLQELLGMRATCRKPAINHYIIIIIIIIIIIRVTNSMHAYRGCSANRKGLLVTVQTKQNTEESLIIYCPLDKAWVDDRS